MLSKLRALTLRELVVCLEAIVLVAAVRLCLAWLPFRMVHLWAGKAQSRLIARVPKESAAKVKVRAAAICLAIDAAANRMPLSTTCLPRALAGHVLLAKHGFASELYIGVARGETGALEAHAWVMVGGQVAIGFVPNLAALTPMPTIEHARA